MWDVVSVGYGAYSGYGGYCGKYGGEWWGGGYGVHPIFSSYITLQHTSYILQHTSYILQHTSHILQHTSPTSSIHTHTDISDQSLNDATDESYVMRVDAPVSFIQARTVFGALHALETFSQACWDSV